MIIIENHEIRYQKSIFWITLSYNLINVDHFLIILDHFGPFWIVFGRNFDRYSIKIDENHWKTKFTMILMKFYIRNPFFESHYHILIWSIDQWLWIISDHFLGHFRSFWTVSGWNIDENRWKTKFFLNYFDEKTHLKHIKIMILILRSLFLINFFKKIS